MARKAKDLKWLYNHPEAIISQETINICARKDGIIRRLLPFCCAFVIACYPEEPWGPDITDEAGCSGLIGGRPWCEDWKNWVCCNRAEFTGNDLVNTLQWGWEGINCASFHWDGRGHLSKCRIISCLGYIKSPLFYRGFARVRDPNQFRTLKSLQHRSHTETRADVYHYAFLLVSRR